MRVDLAIPGGPISVVLTGVTSEPDAALSLGWWTVGGRKLHCSKRGDGPWTLTGHGAPARRERHPTFTLPPKVLRDAFRAYLLTRCRAGEAIDPYTTDHGRHFNTRWGWDDVEWWKWSTPNDGAGTLHKSDAVKWMREQGAKVGVRIREEDEPDPAPDPE